MFSSEAFNELSASPQFALSSLPYTVPVSADGSIRPGNWKHKAEEPYGVSSASQPSLG